MLLVIDPKYNLLSISKLCDKGNQVVFDKGKCEVKCIKTGKVIITAHICDNIYSMFTNKVDNNLKCDKALTID